MKLFVIEYIRLPEAVPHQYLILPSELTNFLSEDYPGRQHKRRVKTKSTSISASMFLVITVEFINF